MLLIKLSNGILFICHRPAIHLDSQEGSVLQMEWKGYLLRQNVHELGPNKSKWNRLLFKECWPTFKGNENSYLFKVL